MKMKTLSIQKNLCEDHMRKVLAECLLHSTYFINVNHKYHVWSAASDRAPSDLHLIVFMTLCNLYWDMLTLATCF